MWYGKNHVFFGSINYENNELIIEYGTIVQVLGY